MDTTAAYGSDSAMNVALPPWEGRAILLVDLDAFFASVEQLDHPEWRGKPVIVGGESDKRGVVSTCSYEARRFGVRSAMPSITATRLCPDAIWARGNFKRYNEMSAQVMDILLAESPLLQQVSIDEAFLDVSPGRYIKEHPVAIATRIQERVARLGVTCSIGVGTSKTVAKIASDMDKPSGITVVYPGTEKRFLAPLPVRAISGVGVKSEQRLFKLGFSTLGDIATCDPALIQPIFGVNTASMQARCCGIDPIEVTTEREVKSVSNEMTFSHDLETGEEIYSAINMLAARVARRLRRKELTGNVIMLKMRYPDLTIRTARRTLRVATSDEAIISQVARALVPELWTLGTGVRLVGVGLGGFEGSIEQLELGDLLDTPQTPEQEYLASSKARTTTARRALAQATDKVKEKYGDGAVRYGRDLRFLERGTGTITQGKDEPVT